MDPSQTLVFLVSMLGVGLLVGVFARILFNN